jgi:flagellar hook-associated protein 2
MATITSIGAGSGLDLATILEGLQKAEDLRLEPIKQRIESFNAKFSAYGQLQNAVSSLQSSAFSLRTTGAFGSVKGVSSNSDVVDLTASVGAVPSSYTITVEQLASAQRLQAAGQTSRTDQLGSAGALTFTVAGQANPITVNLTGTSLNDIALAINSKAELGVSASIINDGAGNYHLMLTAKTSGENAAITSIDAGATGLGFLAFDANTATAGDAPTANSMGLQQAAANALFTVNGVQVTGASNTVTNVIDGVTLTLKGVTTVTDQNNVVSNTPITLDITRDNEAAANAVKEFVNAYNALQDTVRELTDFDVDKQTQMPLTGDSTTRSAQRAMANALQVFMGGNGAFQSLADVGIALDANTGKINLDSSKLDQALASNPTGVANLFSGQNGLVERVTGAANGILGGGGITGSLESAQDGIQSSVRSLERQQANMEDRIAATMETYRQQFVALDSMVAQMNSMSSYLSQQFAALSKQTSG